MDYRTGCLEKVELSKNEMGMDRLSSLPEPIIHHILSLMETKYAIRTCLLSQEWKHHWTQVHSLNFNRRLFSSAKDFAKFVHHVLRSRKPFSLFKLKFQCKRSSETYTPLMKRIYMYAKFHGLEELETDFPDISLPRLKRLPKLRTLKIGPTLLRGNSLNPFGFAFLTTLQLFRVDFQCKSRKFDLSSCLNLENLLLLECQQVRPLKIFRISAPWVVNLTISSCFEHSKRLVVCAPRLKCFNFGRKYASQVLSIGECKILDKLDIHLFPPRFYPDEKLHKYISRLVHFAEGLCQAKSLTISFNPPNKKAILHHSNLDAETELQVLNKNISKELLFVLATVGQYLSKGSFSPDWQLLF